MCFINLLIYSHFKPFFANDSFEMNNRTETVSFILFTHTHAMAMSVFDSQLDRPVCVRETEYDRREMCMISSVDLFISIILWKKKVKNKTKHNSNDKLHQIRCFTIENNFSQMVKSHFFFQEKLISKI